MVEALFNRRLMLGSLFLVSLFGFAPVSHAQWLTQSLEIKEGWNAVFLYVDPSHRDLDTRGESENPISEIWRWNPPTRAQFVDAPPVPAVGDNNWDGWIRTRGDSVLKRLVGDAAYLVKADRDYKWKVKGKPVAPHSTWNMQGLNLVGFPTVPNAPPNFDELLAEVPGLRSPELEIYRYEGLASGEDNPTRLQPEAYEETPVRRGQAFWIRAAAVSKNYSGPFEVVLTGSDGVKFADDLGVYSLRLRNLTPDKLTISMELLESEPPPDGQTDETVGVPPLLVRGALNLDTRNYDAVELPVGSKNQEWELAARGKEGSEVTIVLGLDRSAITEDAGSLLAGILRFKDSLNISEVNVPVSSRVHSSIRKTGLWVGEARVTHVSQHLKSYERHAAQQSDVAAPSGDVVAPPALVIGSDRAYKVTDTDTDPAPTPRWFPLRLIIHKPAEGEPTLLQRVFYGKGPDDEWVVSRSQSELDRKHLGEARRISATHLPWSAANAGWQFDRDLTPRSEVSASAKVTTEFGDQASNPFLHTYHPDHDNLDGRFKEELKQGAESYTVVRTISLKVKPPGNDFNSRISAGRNLTGDYSETIRIGAPADGNKENDSRQFKVRGTFRLHRISDIAVLTAPPR